MQISKTYFNDGWEFRKSANDEWQDVILPHTWNEEDMAPGKLNPYIGQAWYRKKFKLPKLLPGQKLLLSDKRVFLEFEAVAMWSKVFVNGCYVGGRDGGFLGFRLDITDAINLPRDSGMQKQSGMRDPAETQTQENTGTQTQENTGIQENSEMKEHLVEVLADNSYNYDFPPPHNIDWERYGGIYRPVWLIIKNAAFFSYKGIRIQTPNVNENTGEVKIETLVENTANAHGKNIIIKVKHEVIDSNGKIVAEWSGNEHIGYFHKKRIICDTITVKNPHLWSIEDPYLYTVKSTLYSDGIEADISFENIGFRYYHFDKDKGFFLNGKPMKLKGCNDHQEYPGMGHACTDKYFKTTVRHMKEMGMNYVRGSHYPRNDRFLDECDREGIMVAEEQPYWHGSIRAIQGDRFIDKATAMVKDLVTHHMNHPSIILWNIANEVLLAPNFNKNAGHAEPDDPRRVSWTIQKEEISYIKRTLASMYNAFKEVDPLRPVMYVVGSFWKQNDKYEFASIPDIVGYNGGALNTTDYMDVDFADSRQYPLLIDYLREQYPERTAIMSEGIINSRRVAHNRANWIEEEEKWKGNAFYWNMIYERDWFSGGSMWNFTDYYANGQLRVMGTMDVRRLPLEMYYFYSAMWSNKPVLHILCHWDWVYTSHLPDNITVFTNCSDVELFQDDISLGKGRRMSAEWPMLPNPPIIWEGIKYRLGKIIAIGYYGDDNRIISDIRVTSSEPAKIELIAENDENSCKCKLIADGMDICFIKAVITDNNGNRCYTVDTKLSLHVEGCAILKGESILPVTGGITRFAIRSNEKKGKCIVKATAEGLRDAILSIDCCE